MSASMLQFVEEVLASRAPSAISHPVRDDLLPRLEIAETLDEAELVIHDGTAALAALGEALVREPDGRQLVEGAFERTIATMLASQDEVGRAVESASNRIAAWKAVIAHETLRRILVVCSEAREDAKPEDQSRPDVSPLALPTRQYVRDVTVRLALLVIAIEHLAPRRTLLVAELASKALETSQTLRGTMSGLGIDLTPWVDAPAETRARRIAEAGRAFWEALAPEQQRAVAEGWTERLDLPPRWQRPS